MPDFGNHSPPCRPAGGKSRNPPVPTRKRGVPGGPKPPNLPPGGCPGSGAACAGGSTPRRMHVKAPYLATQRSHFGRVGCTPSVLRTTLALALRQTSAWGVGREKKYPVMGGRKETGSPLGVIWPRVLRFAIDIPTRSPVLGGMGGTCRVEKGVRTPKKGAFWGVPENRPKKGGKKSVQKSVPNGRVIKYPFFCALFCPPGPHFWPPLGGPP